MLTAEERPASVLKYNKMKSEATYLAKFNMPDNTPINIIWKH